MWLFRSVTSISTTTQNLKLLGVKMIKLCPFLCILTSATPPRCHTPFGKKSLLVHKVFLDWTDHDSNDDHCCCMSFWLLVDVLELVIFSSIYIYYHFCMVVDIEITDQWRIFFKKGCGTQGAWHLWVYTKMGITQSFLHLGVSNFVW